MIDLFTKQEKIFISFLVFGILLGAAIRIYRSYVEPANQIDPQIILLEQQFKQKAAEIDSLIEQEEEIFPPKQAVSQSVVSSPAAPQKPIKKEAGPVDINQATVEDLIQIPQIGRVIATRIIEYRSVHGDFKEIEDLLEVKGIGPKKLQIIRSYIYIRNNSQR